MCGRFTHLYSWTELQALMRITTDLSVPLLKRFNVAPTQQVPIVRQREDGAREAVLMRWGLVPGWAKDPAFGDSDPWPLRRKAFRYTGHSLMPQVTAQAGL